MNYKTSLERNTDYLNSFGEHDLLKSLVSDRPVILDVGADRGQSYHSLRSIWPQADIYSIEPRKEAYNECRKENPNSFNVAFGAYDGSDTLYVNSHQPMLSSFYNINEHSKDSIDLAENKTDILQHTTEKVKVMRMDTFVGSDLPVDVIKMDCQGYEDKILAGGRKTIAKAKVVITEVMLYDLYEKSSSFFNIEKYLLPDYRLVDIGYVSRNPMTGMIDWVDAIYAKV